MSNHYNVSLVCTVSQSSESYVPSNRRSALLITFAIRYTTFMFLTKQTGYEAASKSRILLSYSTGGRSPRDLHNRIYTIECDVSVTFSSTLRGSRFRTQSLSNTRPPGLVRARYMTGSIRPPPTRLQALRVVWTPQIRRPKPSYVSKGVFPPTGGSPQREMCGYDLHCPARIVLDSCAGSRPALGCLSTAAQWPMSLEIPGVDGP